MKNLLIGLLVLAAGMLIWDYQTPEKPNRVIKVEVIALKASEKGDGWREITVRMPEGNEQVIETLAPFFYKPGYLAHVAYYNRYIWPDVYDFVPTVEALP
jgi:hypothetical protein